jgi:hypothetical protein
VEEREKSGIGAILRGIKEGKHQIYLFFSFNTPVVINEETTH